MKVQTSLHKIQLNISESLKFWLKNSGNKKKSGSGSKVVKNPDYLEKKIRKLKIQG